MNLVPTGCVLGANDCANGTPNGRMLLMATLCHIEGADAEKQLSLTRLASVGRPVADIEMPVVNPNGEEVSPGEGGERVMAAAVMREGVTEEDLLAFAKSRLASFKRPDRILLVETLPRNSTGKRLRRDLRSIFA